MSRRSHRRVVPVLFVLLAVPVLFAEDDNSSERFGVSAIDPNVPLEVQLADAMAKGRTAQAAFLVEEIRAQTAKKEFLGFNFGIGFSLSVDLHRDRVDDASVVGGRVRVSKESQARPRVLLESHYYFEPDGKLGNLPADRWGHGPFVAIQGSGEEVIEAFGLGWMLGLRRAKDQEEGFNVGLGLIYDPSVKGLGDGIRQNKPLPAGETEVRFKEEGRLSALLSVSFSFN